MRGEFLFFKNNKFYYYIIFFYLVLLAVALYFSNNIESYDQKLKNLFLSHSVDIIDDTSTNVIQKMLEQNSDFVNNNIKNSKVRIQNEKDLAVLVNQDILSLYVLYILNDRLFFLLDTATKDKGELGQPFLPENEHHFKLVSKQQKRMTFMQEELGELGFTLIKPIIQNKKTVGFLVVDYSQSRLDDLSSLLKVSIEVVTIFMFLVMFLLFLFLLYMMYANYMKYKIYHNPQTNTLNRIYLTENYEKINFQNYYIALADLDLFKRINNLYGHENGNMVITSTIKSIYGLMENNDMLIQYGGEEFLLLLSKESRDEESCRVLIEDIRVTIERTKFNINNEGFFLTLSIGVLIDTEKETTLQHCIHKADTALYEAKHDGRNKVCYYDMKQSKILYREKLQEMIDSDKLVCYYQPIRSLKDSSLHHYEALLRIEDGDNIIFPDKILPDLEDSYLYTHLTKRIIEYNIHILRFDDKIKISINLSADDLINDAILALLAQNSDLSDRLYIEILENKSINYVKVEKSIQRLKLFGYKICIDDFGSGYSNLNHLLNLSIDYLKIDGSIIKEIYHDRRAYSIVKTFASFCQENDIEVIAEFIDNQEVVDILKSFGVEYGQGFFFSPGKPYEELPKGHD